MQLRFDGDGETCNDIDECTSKFVTHNCDINASCSNTVGSFDCSCNNGYDGDGVNCADVDECANGDDNCDVNASCSNTVGRFDCTCDIGYSGTGDVCSDIDECNDGSHNCDSNASCINQVGSFEFECNTGYSGNGVTCDDKNKCELGEDYCDINAACTNTVGRFECNCNDGYIGDGVDGTCTDVDECFDGTNNCDDNATCDNTVGSFTCECKIGYSGDGVVCENVDKCLIDSIRSTLSPTTIATTTINDQPRKRAAGQLSHNCAVEATCKDTVGSFTCDCNLGYEGTGTECNDIDECDIGTANCDSRDDPSTTLVFRGDSRQSFCSNTDGSYECFCARGYLGDGQVCEDNDECSNGHGCDPSSDCKNTIGTYYCECMTGLYPVGPHSPGLGFGINWIISNGPIRIRKRRRLPRPR